jgi:O-antigen/teichoic acid export membrane protein
VIVTWFTALCAFVVVGMWLLARWIVRLLAAPEFFQSYEAIGLVCTGITLYALYLVLVVILGRTGRTEYNFPAAAAATAVNVGLNLVLIPPLGIVGAGIALVASYLLVLALMYAFTQRLFSVPYEWRRLGLVVVTAATLVAGGELLLPTDGADGLIPRIAVWLTFPLVLWAAGFLEPAEREALRSLRAQLRERAPWAPAPEGPPAEPSGSRGPRMTPEVYEAERRDEDARL